MNSMLTSTREEWSRIRRSPKELDTIQGTDREQDLDNSGISIGSHGRYPLHIALNQDPIRTGISIHKRSRRSRLHQRQTRAPCKQSEVSIQSSVSTSKYRQPRTPGSPVRNYQQNKLIFSMYSDYSLYTTPWLNITLLRSLSSSRAAFAS